MFHSSANIWGTSGASVATIPTNPLSSDKSTLDSLAVMRCIVKNDAHSPEVVSLSYRLAADAPTLRAYAQAVWFWVHDHLTFIHHEAIVEGALVHEAPIPPDAQLLIPPSSLLRMPTMLGDCAIYSTLVASLLITKGIETWFRVVCADVNEPDIWGHVYVVAKLNGDFVVMDASHGHYFGWETPNKIRQLDYKV
jgi:hypothetical protein